MVAAQQMNVPPIWEATADDVLAVVMKDEAAYRYARFEAGLRPAQMPEKHRAALQAVYSLRDANEVIHDTTVVARAGGSVDIIWVNQILAQHDAMIADPRVFKANVALLIDEGLKHGTVRLLALAADQITRGNKPRETVTRNLVDILTGLSTAGHTFAEVMASEHGAQYAARLLESPKPIRSTGIAWMDELTFGYQPATLWWLVGAYKSRKTTVLLNMALGAALLGERPAIMSREMTQEQIYWQLVSMLAVALLKKRGLAGQVHVSAAGNRIPLTALSPVGLMTAYSSYKKWPAEKVRAIDDAIALYSELPIRVYDSTPRHGNLSDIESLGTAIDYDLDHFGGTVMYGDYIQLFTTAGDSMAQVAEKQANFVQDKSKRRNTPIVFVAQQNETGVKGEQSYSPNVAGGGAVPRTANALIMTKYKTTEESADSELTLIMKLARNAASNTDSKFDIHPSTGLIANQSWFERLPS